MGVKIEMDLLIVNVKMDFTYKVKNASLVNSPVPDVLQKQNVQEKVKPAEHSPTTNISELVNKKKFFLFNLIIIIKNYILLI